jgi:rubrerythrin
MNVTPGGGLGGEPVRALRDRRWHARPVRADEREPVDDEGGDPACWLRRVCPACGRMADEDPPTRCPACGAELPAD